LKTYSSLPSLPLDAINDFAKLVKKSKELTNMKTDKMAAIKNGKIEPGYFFMAGSND
jgi:hypothetical protein